MRLLLLALIASPAVLAEPAPSPTAVAPASSVVAHADLRGSYLAGFPLLVRVSVKNSGSAPVTFPDLRARPHLVKFQLDGPKGKSERYSTPPAREPTDTWTILPGSERTVLLEIPSSAGFAAGDWSIGVTVNGLVAAAPTPARLEAARPVAGAPLWEPGIAASAGVMFPWVHQAAKGYDLYLAKYRAKVPDRLEGQYHLAHLQGRVEPVLTRSRPGEAQSRYLYWLQGDSLAFARLEGQQLRLEPKLVGLPYPKMELLGRGATTRAQTLSAPAWVPAPSGSAGELQVIEVDERGRPSFRKAAALPRRPDEVATAVDAASNLLFAVVDSGGVALYRADPSQPAELPAKGTRAWRSEAGWTVRGLTFETLAESPDFAGGLALLVVATRTTDTGEQERTLWIDLGGRVFRDQSGGTWSLQGRVQSLLPTPQGDWSALSQDTTGAFWYAPRGSAAAKVDITGPAALWSKADQILVRTLGTSSVTKDTPVGKRQP